MKKVYLILKYFQVDLYVSRDLDSRLNEREKAAVQEWLHSSKGTFLSEDTNVFDITPKRRTFFFLETENLNCLEIEEVLKFESLEAIVKGQEGRLWLARAALKITKIQIFSFKEEKCLSVHTVII